MSNAQDPTDGVLAAASRGDPGAVRRALEVYGGLVWSVARTYCASRQDAEDAAQEAFIRLWQAGEKFDPARGSEATFVVVVARTAVLEFLRRQRRVARAVSAASTTPQPTPQPASGHPGWEEAKRAAEVLATLPHEQREVISLSVGQGLTHEGIASHLGVPLGTVKTRIRAGFMRLREALTDSRGNAGKARTEGSP